jgi:hypothetical protein
MESIPTKSFDAAPPKIEYKPLPAPVERVWADKNGRWSFEGTLVSVEGENVKIKKSFNNTIGSYLLNDLCKDDRDYLGR